MEYRTIEQVRLYVLVLNTFGRVEDGAVAAVSADYNKLVNFYMSQLLAPEDRYRDNSGMYISFKDGPLRNFNPCFSLELNNTGVFGHGIHDEWIPVTSFPSVRTRYYMVE